MIVHDAPAVRQLLQDECEQSAQLLFLCLELPATADIRTVAAERFNSKVAEGEFAHFLPLRPVALVVALERRFPAFRVLSAGEKAEALGFPVAGHEAVEVAAVPGGDLVVENFLDGLLIGRRFFCTAAGVIEL